ncbi:MAG: hypothetical protein ACTHKF_06700 [Candidatus Nitrosocosmicus sp.]
MTGIKFNLIAIVAVLLSVSMITSSFVVEAFSQTNSSKGNATRDIMGNFVHGNSTSMKGTGNNLTKDYPTNASI